MGMKGIGRRRRRQREERRGAIFKGGADRRRRRGGDSRRLTENERNGEYEERQECIFARYQGER